MKFLRKRRDSQICMWNAPVHRERGKSLIPIEGKIGSIRNLFIRIGEIYIGTEDKDCKDRGLLEWGGSQRNC